MWEKREAISQDLYQILLIRTAALVCLTLLSQFRYFERSFWSLLCSVKPWGRSSPSGLPVLLVQFRVQGLLWELNSHTQILSCLRMFV